MGYELHIERPESPISEPEWRVAVQAIPGLRLGGPPMTATNPQTGEVIRVPVLPSDVQMRFKREWIPVFRFVRGRATFAAGRGSYGANHPVRVAAAALARRLGAEIRGDEGESYDW